MRAVIYARYSTDLQSASSIDDQGRLCRARLEGDGHELVKVYSDRAISGATLIRPGIQLLLEDAHRHCFDLVYAEALDRISRDQEDAAAFFKKMTFAAVRIVTVAEGEISELHVGLKGTMNALFLKDLAQKTRRGLEGRIRQGKSGGGLCFGYDVVRKITADGEAIRGERRINETEAAIVRRIFAEFGDGRSPRGIAQALNQEHIPGPMGGTWGLPPSMATGSVVPAFSITSSMSAGSSGTVSTSSRTQVPGGVRRGLTRKTNGSSSRCRI